MVMKFFDGFENEWRARWSFYEESGSLSTTTGRVFGKSLNISAGAGFNDESATTPNVDIADGNTAFIGFGHMYLPDSSTNSSGSWGGIYLYDSTGSQAALLMPYLNGFRFYGGEFSGATGASPTTRSTSTWYWVEIEYLPLNTGGVFKLWVDGVLQMDLSGDTTNAGESFGSMRWRSRNSHWRQRIDDVYIADSTGSVNNSRVGDCYVRQLLPTGQGHYAEGVGSDGDSVDNYVHVDEDFVDENDYVEMREAASRESYATTGLPAGESPVAARVSAYGFDGDSKSTVDTFLRIGTSDYDGGEETPVTILGRWVDRFWNANPMTGTAWAEGDLDGAEFGVKRVK